MAHSAEKDAPVAPHPRCGIGRKREHGPHRFRALIMGGLIRLYCPGCVFPSGDPTADHGVYQCKCVTDEHEKPHAYVFPPGEVEA